MPPKRRPRARDGGPQPPPSSAARVCKFYNEQGNCRFGEKCKFLHSSLQGDEIDAPTTAAEQAVGDAPPEEGPTSAGGHAAHLYGVLSPPGRVHGSPHPNYENGALPPEPGLADHVSPPQPSPNVLIPRTPNQGKPKSKNPCFALQRTGRCRKGDQCGYSHDVNTNQTGLRPVTSVQEQELANASRGQARYGDDERRRQAEERRKERERSERERLERERMESAPLEQDRGERLPRQLLEKATQERQNVERERLLGEQLERTRLEKERLAKALLAKKRLEKQRFERQRLEWERQESERLERERLERERLERERLERERLEWERLESERLERERLERERLEAERLERQRAEAERVAREQEAAAARRAEAKERKQREREAKLARERERLLQEQEAKRQREAKVTLQFVVQGSNLVTFGPGLDVQCVVPGFDLCKVVIRNLPANATDKEVVGIFKERGVNETMLKLLECRAEGGTKVAKVLTRREEAEVLSVGLDGLEFRQSILAFEVEDNTAWGSMKSSASATEANTLTFFWSAPSVVMIATYETVEEARRKARALDRRQFRGRAITAILNPRPNGAAAKYWVEASVKIGNLAPGTIDLDVEVLAGTTSVRPIKSNDYDQASFMNQLELYLRLDGYVAGSLEATEMQAGTGRMKGTARFPSQEALQKGAERLNRGMFSWPRIRVAEQHQYSILISGGQYRAQKALWDSMTETARGKKAYVRINERRNGQVFVNVEGSEEKEVGELKVRVESLVAGERLGAEHWHRTFAYSGKPLFDRVMAETNVLVTVDRRFQALRLFGASNDLAQAKDIIRQDVERLELMEYTLPIERRSVRFFVATGLPILKEALGEDNVTLDVSSQQCSLKLRGGEDAIKHAQRLVEEAVNAARGGLPVLAQVDDDGGSPCPICYDTPTHPEVLSCGHSCCEPCLRHYISSAATSDTFPLVCLGNDATCNTPISVPIVHRYLTQQRFTVLIDAVFASYIQSNARKFKYCTTPDCTQIYQCDTDKQFHQCPACFSRICSSCNEEAHEGMTCEQRRIQSDPAEQDRLNNVWAQTNNIKKCPTCMVMTEKTEGCNHMTCRCGAHWCWVCGKAFARDTIYEHMRAAHGGIGLPGDPVRVVNVPPPAVVGGLGQGLPRVVGFGAALGGRREPELNLGGANFNFKQCPGCAVLTEKAGGDNHMTCRCGAHWCWACRIVFPREAIYAHLRAVHGGIGLIGEVDRTRELQAEEFRRRWRVEAELERERRAAREREQRAEAHRVMQRQMAEDAARRQAEKKDDSWCSIM